MAPLTPLGPNLETRELASGWVNQPDGRGTIDIMWSCTITILLCSWSILCLNVPAIEQSRISSLIHKCRWWAFTVFFPEVVTGLAQEQWLSAKQSVSEFRALGCTPWTMSHAFFSDMGGFVLESPDFPTIPIDSHQLYYLVKQGYLDFPDVGEQTIRDKNKADRFTRVLTLLQTVWFGLQCLGRKGQNLPISTFELSTVAFVFCTIPTSFFWYFKPQDVEVPIVLKTTTRMADILTKVDDTKSTWYIHTPLDIINPSSRASVLAAFFYSLETIGISGRQKSRPIKAFPNSKIPARRDFNPIKMIPGLIVAVGYSAVHLIGWNFTFPTPIEEIFWRVASLSLLTLITLYLVFIAVGMVVFPALS